AGSADHFAKNVVERLRLKRDSAIKGFVVFGHRDKINLRPSLAIISIEIREQKGTGQLSGPVGAKVERENDIPITYALLLGMRKDQWLKEFVGLADLITFPDRNFWRCIIRMPTAQYDGIPGQFISLPAS